jgi:hypothetical protein
MKQFIIFLFITYTAITQAADGYKNKAHVDSVPAKGFYKIILSPEVVSCLQSNYSDIRLVNARQQEIPYLFTEEARTSYKSYFQELPIIDNSPLYSPKLSRVVIDNAGKKVFTALLFIIRNTTLMPEVTIKGSDDKQNWFFISHETLESYGSTDNDTSEIRSVQFPKNNYRYFEISIPHNKGEAIQFIKAGYSSSERLKGLYTPIAYPKVLQKDSLKKSYITLLFNRPYSIDKLEIDIAGPDYFMRSCSLGKYVKQRNHSVYFDSWYHYTLSSDKANTWEFNNLKSDTLFLEIENEDNLPLKIRQVKAFQLNKYLIAQLNPGESYELLLNNPEASAASYDLKYFSTIIPAHLPVLNVDNVESIVQSQALKPATSFFNKQMVWIVIIIVIIALGAISVKLLNDMKNSKMEP